LAEIPAKNTLTAMMKRYEKSNNPESDYGVLSDNHFSVFPSWHESGNYSMKFLGSQPLWNYNYPLAGFDPLKRE